MTPVRHTRQTLRQLLMEDAPDLLEIVPENLREIEITLLEPDAFYDHGQLRAKLERMVHRICELCYRPDLVH